MEMDRAFSAYMSCSFSDVGREREKHAHKRQLQKQLLLLTTHHPISMEFRFKKLKKARIRKEEDGEMNLN